MIILDSNVIAEFMRPEPARVVEVWLRKQNETPVTTSISIAEVAFGLERLPEGRRKQGMRNQFERFVSGGFTAHVFSFDEAAALTYSVLLANLQRRGLTIGPLDAMIAAIALENYCAIATRNVSDFAHTGLRIINPWA